MPEGHQSPPPEEQSGAQLRDPPASGKGTDNADNKGEKLQSELDKLSSNPKGPMDDTLADKFSKEKKGE